MQDAHVGWRGQGGQATPASMSRSSIATVAGVLFIFAYIAAAITIPDLTGRMHWTIEAVYWLLAGVVWVLPIRWLMLWAVHKR